MIRKQVQFPLINLYSNHMSDGQVDKVVAFRREGQGFEPSYRLSACPPGSSIMCMAPFPDKNDVHKGSRR